MMKKYFPLLLALAAFTACDDAKDLMDLDDEERPKEKPQKVLQVVRSEFDADAKTITLSTVLTKDIGEVPLDKKDSVQVKVLETSLSDKPVSLQPVFTQLYRTGMQEIVAAHLHMSLIVDMTLSPKLVEAQRSAARQIASVFGSDNMSIVFLRGSGLSRSFSAADFVLENDFTPDEGGNKKLLLNAILTTIKAAKDSTAAHPERKNIVLAFSNGKVYNGARTIDPQHFNRQEELTQICSEDDPSMAFYYVNFASQNAPGEAEYFLKSLCESSKGFYEDGFAWNKMAEYLFAAYDLNYTDFKIVLTNPDGKLYNGDRKLSMEFYYKDDLAADLETSYTCGSFHQPVIVAGTPRIQVLLQGLLISLLLMVLIYLVLQYVVPRISYILFKKKYIATYTGGNMSVNGVLVGDTCYYCKAPFLPGDKIVARCKHVMHQQCWEENGHHCPEYGRNCKEGSHYYNARKPSDRKNASFLMRWMLAGVIAGFVSWLFFSSIDNGFAVGMMESILMKIYNLKEGTVEALNFQREFASHLNQLPSFGLGMGFASTLALSLLTVYKRNTRRMVVEIALRSIIGAGIGFVFFMLGCIVSQIFNLGGNSYLLDWIPWAATGYAIVLCSTIGTTVKVRKKWILISIGLGVVSMLLWNLIFVAIGTDYRTLLLLSHVVFSVGMALSVAQASPRSERYFLHVGGSMKEMDIAIYKWFEANTNRVVSVGKSVDCDLVMSWDVKGDIAPVQAQLTKEGDRVYITPLEPGIIVKGKTLPTGKRERLFHGKVFTIGTTEFRYVEKDV